jgi:hypothetical protein
MSLVWATRPYFWIAILVDYGTLVFLMALPKLVKEEWKTSRFNLCYEYVSRTRTRTVRLRLFRQGVFAITVDLCRPPGEPGLLSTGRVGGWHRQGSRVTLQDRQESASFEELEGRTTQNPAPVIRFF